MLFCHMGQVTYKCLVIYKRLDMEKYVVWKENSIRSLTNYVANNVIQEKDFWENRQQKS